MTKLGISLLRLARRSCQCYALGRFALLLLFLLTAAVAVAQDTTADYIDPRVDHRQFTALCQQLGLESTQRPLVELVFTDYNTALTDLTRKLDDQALKAGRKTVQDALAGKARIAPEDLKRMRIEVLNVYQQAFPAVDKALGDLLNGVEMLLTTEQTARFDPAVRELRRNILLHPRQAGSDYQEYAGDGVDVLLLAEIAQKQDGELHSLSADALQPILANYEQQLDAFLIQSAPAYRAGKLARKIAAIQKDAAVIHQEEQAALNRWKQLYQLNRQTVEEIAATAAAGPGELARQSWLDRFDQASFTWLYPRRKPDRQIEWVRQQKQVSAEQLQQAESIYDQYVAHRKELSRKAIEMMVRGRMEFQTMLYSMMDPTGMDDRVRRGLYEELVKNTGEQSILETTTSGALEGLLSESQRESLRDAMKKPDSAARRR